MFTLDRAFDIVAPIAIYYAADVCFKRKAETAIEHVREAAERGEKWPANVEDPCSYPLLEDVEHWSQESYDRLFEAIVEDMTTCWSWHFDAAGSKEYLDINDKPVFAGDKYGMFPLYESAADLRARIREVGVERGVCTS